MKKKFLFQDGSTSDEFEPDWISDEEEEAKPKIRISDAAKKSCKSQESASDSEAEGKESEKCPICLIKFRKQAVGNPSICDHCFCLECILEWSKNVNTCPVDRQEFTLINIRENYGDQEVSFLFFFLLLFHYFWKR